MNNHFYEGGLRDDITFYLILSRDCNGGCEYCYQDKSFRTKEVMTKQVIDDTIRFTLSKFQENKITYYFFGGEPTLNWDMITYALEKYPQLKFHMTTNGLVLAESQEKRDFIKKHAYHMSMSVSIEPLIRKYGADSFMEKARPLLELLTGMNSDIHMVISDIDKDAWFERLFKELLEKGIKRVRISSVKCSSKLNNRIEDVGKMLCRLADYIYFEGEPKWGRSSFDYYFMSNLTHKMLGKDIKDVPPTLCGAGYSYIAVDVNGDLYPCDMFASMKALKMGSIYTGFESKTSVFLQKDEWRKELFEDCGNCKVVEDFRLCPHAMCLAENYQKYGSPFKPVENHCILNQVDIILNKYLVNKAIEKGCIKSFCRSAQTYHSMNMGRDGRGD